MLTLPDTDEEVSKTNVFIKGFMVCFNTPCIIIIIACI